VKFGWKERYIAEALRSFPYTLVNPGRRPAVVSDPADNRVLECAFAATADFLASGDRHYLRPFLSRPNSRASV
jgi:predicted nucleic acid-binding protein